MRGSRGIAVVVAIVVLVGGTVLALLLRIGGPEPDDEGASPAAKLAATDRTIGGNDPLERACALPHELLRRVWRGHDPVHSEDVTIVPLAPNYSGSFSVTSHSGPWDYLQTVPLVFYGPAQIKPLGRLERTADITDVYATVGELTGAPLEPRAGTARNMILSDGDSPPKVVVTVMWDGVGRNVLERWPDAWPNLARLEREGASFVNAIVGSSPSITPATHSTIGTGDFPRSHGVTAIEFRADDGSVASAFAGRDPKDLELSTFGDQIDRYFENRSKVGFLGWRAWQMGMMGHGSQYPGGDADQLGVMGLDDQITGNPDFYSTPEYLAGFPGLQKRFDEVDRSDGAMDGEWMGHVIAETHDNPAWINYETDVLVSMLENEGYGEDDVPDLFFTNYKMTDIVGHQYTMDSREMSEVLKAQDAALGRLVDYLDEEVGDYVLVLSADHGHTPSPERSGAWPILQGRLSEDVDEHFEVTGKSLIRQTTAVGPFLDAAAMEAAGVTAAGIAEFLNGYTIRDNWGPEDLPEGYEGRGEENVFAAAFASGQLDEIMECAFGDAPPEG